MKERMNKTTIKKKKIEGKTIDSKKKKEKEKKKNWRKKENWNKDKTKKK